MPNFPTHAIVGVGVGLIVLALLQLGLGALHVNLAILPLFLPSWGGLYAWFIQWVAIIALILFSAFLPDLDLVTSTVSKLILLVLNILTFLFILPYVVGFFPSDILLHLISYIVLFIIISTITYIGWRALCPKHRGWVHSLFANTLWAVIVYILWNFNLGMATVSWVGYFSHLLLDSEVKPI